MNVTAIRAAGDPAAVEIRTDRLRLRPPVAADRDAVVVAIGRWEVARWLARVPHPYAAADAEAFIAASAARRVAGRTLALFVLDDDGLAGCVGLDELGPAPELGYWIAPDRWGRGYATEAATAAVALAFDRLGAGRIRSGVFAGNDASLAVQRKLGFEITGRSRVFCLARGEELDHIDTVLARAPHAQEDSKR